MSTKAISDKIQSNQDIIFYILSVLASVLVILALYSGFSEKDMNAFFCSDALYLPSIYKDIFTDHSGVQGWYLNPAPNFFPDMLLYFLIMFICRNFIIATFIYSVIQYLFLLFLILYLFRLLISHRPVLYAGVANLLMLLFFFVKICSHDFMFTFFLVSNSFHMGAFMMAFLCMIITFKYFQNPKKSYLVWLALICFLSIVSDRLFIMLYSLPSFLLIIFYSRVRPHKKLVFMVIVNIISVALGLFIFKLISNGNFIQIDDPHRLFDFKDIKESIVILSHQWWHYLKDVTFIRIIMVISFASFISLCYIFFSNIKKELSTFNLYIYFVIIYTLIVFFAPVINGNYTGPDILRYNIYVVYMLVIDSCIAATYFINKMNQSETVRNVLKAVMIVCLAGVFLEGSLQLSFPGLKRYFTFYPKSVECIDNIAKIKHFKYGIGNYWIAKYATMFSKNSIRIYAVTDNVVPQFHVSNSNWYFSDKAKFEFLVLDESQDHSPFVNKLGKLENDANCEGWEVIPIRPFKFDKATWQLRFTDSLYIK